jgi:hypothetical protein
MGFVPSADRHRPAFFLPRGRLDRLKRVQHKGRISNRYQPVDRPVRDHSETYAFVDKRYIGRRCRRYRRRGATGTRGNPISAVGGCPV